MDEQTSFFQSQASEGFVTVSIDEPWCDLAPAVAASQEPALQFPPITAIAKLTLQPGDSLVVFLDGAISMDQAAKLRSYVQRQLCTDAPVLVLDGGAGIGVLSTPEAEAAEPDSGAKTLPGALSEASGGHRLGGWGATG